MLSELNIARFITTGILAISFFVLVNGPYQNVYVALLFFVLDIVLLPVILSMIYTLGNLSFGNIPTAPIQYVLVTTAKAFAVGFSIPILILSYIVYL